MKKQKTYVNIEPVMRVDTSATIRSIPEGTTARLARKVYGTELTIRSMCTRFNREAGYTKYSLSTIEKGDYMDITNNTKN